MTGAHSNIAPALWIENLFFQFPNQLANKLSSQNTPFQLSIPTLKIERGERIALIGASGSGKSTLLGLICGILSPQMGRLELFGQALQNMSAKQRDLMRAKTLGIIFQQFNLLPYLSVLDNVILALEFAPSHKISQHEKKQKALHLLKALDIDTRHMIHQKVSQLSVGQQQRVAAARAFVGDPPLIIADEPTSALDEGRQAEFLELLFARQSQTNATLLMVTHDPRVAAHFDRTLNMHDICAITAAHEVPA